eukprot:1474153-Rhodomonas_salina.2
MQSPPQQVKPSPHCWSSKQTASHSPSLGAQVPKQRLVGGPFPMNENRLQFPLSQSPLARHAPSMPTVPLLCTHDGSISSERWIPPLLLPRCWPTTPTQVLAGSTFPSKNARLNPMLRSTVEHTSLTKFRRPINSEFLIAARSGMLDSASLNCDWNAVHVHGGGIPSFEDLPKLAQFVREAFYECDQRVDGADKFLQHPTWRRNEHASLKLEPEVNLRSGHRQSEHHLRGQFDSKTRSCQGFFKEASECSKALEHRKDVVDLHGDRDPKVDVGLDVLSIAKNDVQLLLHRRERPRYRIDIAPLEIKRGIRRARVANLEIRRDGRPEGDSGGRVARYDVTPGLGGGVAESVEVGHPVEDGSEAACVGASERYNDRVDFLDIMDLGVEGRHLRPVAGGYRQRGHGEDGGLRV